MHTSQPFSVVPLWWPQLSFFLQYGGIYRFWRPHLTSWVSVCLPSAWVHWSRARYLASGQIEAKLQSPLSFSQMFSRLLVSSEATRHHMTNLDSASRFCMKRLCGSSFTHLFSPYGTQRIPYRWPSLQKVWYQVIPFIWMQSKFLFERSLREEESQVNSERGAELI